MKRLHFLSTSLLSHLKTKLNCVKTCKNESKPNLAVKNGLKIYKMYLCV